MVAIFTGQGSGAQRGSGAVLGGVGVIGSGTAGRSGKQVMLNAANGNLMIQQADTMLVGRGADVAVARSYNSKADPNQSGGSGPWTQNSRKIDATEAIGRAGSKIKLYDTDGSVITYEWDGSGYTTTAGSGAYDRIVERNGKWIRTDGDTRTTEEYGDWDAARYYLTKSTDESGNSTQYTYAGRGRISRITATDGSWIQYDYDIWGNGPNAISATIGYRDLATDTMRTQKVSYTYDNGERLVSATIDLSPEDNSTADGRV